MRPQPAQYIFSLVSIVIILAVFLALGFNPSALIAGLIGGGIVIVLQTTRAGVELRPQALVQNFGIRTQTVPWSEISDVRPVSAGGARIVEAVLGSGRRLRLYLPRSGGLFGRDPDFDAKAELIRQAWAAGRTGPAPPDS
jgi:hypothetical protein